MSLQIRQDALHHLDVQVAGNFQSALAAWLSAEQLLPADVEDADVERFARQAIQRAWSHDLRAQDEIAQFATLAALFGLDFDLDPSLVLLTSPLRDSQLSAGERIDQTIDRFAAWLDAGHEQRP